MTGCEMIFRERERQKSEERFDADHDNRMNPDGELAKAAECYCQAAQTAIVRDDTSRYLKVYGLASWPWRKEWWKPSNDPINNLVKAGALIAAEIDRLTRLRERTKP